MSLQLSLSHAIQETLASVDLFLLATLPGGWDRCYLTYPNGIGARGAAGVWKCGTRRKSQGGADRATSAPSRRRTRTTLAVAEVRTEVWLEQHIGGTAGAVAK